MLFCYHECMEDTIFTKIIQREIPATIVYENDTAIAFLDIHPVSKGHTLLVSKTPYRWIDDMPDDELASLIVTTKSLMKRMKTNLPCDYVQLSVVGEEVPHVHIHLIPRMHEDSPKNFETISYAEGEVAAIAETLKGK